MLLPSPLQSAADEDELVPTTAGRGAAIRQHVLELPARIVAAALGYHQVTTARLAAEAGTTWEAYDRGRYRHPVRHLRLRADLDPADVERWRP